MDGRIKKGRRAAPGRLGTRKESARNAAIGTSRNDASERTRQPASASHKRQREHTLSRLQTHHPSINNIFVRFSHRNFVSAPSAGARAGAAGVREPLRNKKPGLSPRGAALRNDGVGPPPPLETLRNDGEARDSCFLNARNRLYSCRVRVSLLSEGDTRSETHGLPDRTSCPGIPRHAQDPADRRGCHQRRREG